MSRFKMRAVSTMLTVFTERHADGSYADMDEYPFILNPKSIESATRDAIRDARSAHREFASWHEAYAVIREELEEFWDSVKRNQPDLDELLQVAACCQLAIKELGNTGGERELNTYEISGPTKSMRESLARAVAEQEGRDELF